MRRVTSGHPEPLGVTPQRGGVNVAVFSAHASSIAFCLFDADGGREVERIALPERTGDVFHAFIDDVASGARYGLRATGPFDPRTGHRFNAAKLLIDPYVRALDRRIVFHPALWGGGSAPDPRDSAPHVPKGIVTAPAPPVPPPAFVVPWSQTIVYELHVRGFTKMLPSIPDALRGTCAGLAHPAAIAHLTRLGVTTIELMPLSAAVDERHLAALSLTNYWRYNPIAWFVPESHLAPGGIVEVAACVAALHAAGFEVILDVVLNHSGEGDALGPTLSLRGLDNATYYRMNEDVASRYVDDSGCGNTLALDRPPMLRLALDALRHLALATGVDGFRFDLATTLGRRASGFDPEAPLLQAIAQDPVLRERKLIAEPWDVGAGGYRLGAFPAGWGEWNDRCRSTIRRFWRGDGAATGELATRLSGSSDVFAPRSRPPSRSVNFVTAHDGFTLADLVSYEAKHNEANGEDNRDGETENHSWNHGVEGPTGDAAIVAARRRDVRSVLATLLVARGTPMLSMGDELGRTQGGNNNAYAQDNAVSWIDWARADDELIDFAGALCALRRAHPALREDRWLTGAGVDATGIPDVEWRAPDGLPLTAADWAEHGRRALVAAFYTPAADSHDADRVVVALNAGTLAVDVRWPEPRPEFAWRCAVDTAAPGGRPAEAAARIDAPTTPVAGRSVVVLAEEKRDLASAHRSGIDPAALARLAEAAGIRTEWTDVHGIRHAVSPDTQRALLDAMGLGASSTADARARLQELSAARDREPLPAAAVAARCHVPDELTRGERRFGLAAHLYSLRRAGDLGVGDFTTLEIAAGATARAGGSILGINPLHALFTSDRERASPYHPSDRRLIDPLYIDVERVPDFDASREARAILAANERALAELARRDDVDYAAAWRVKRAVLDACFAAFDRRPDSDPLAREFAGFVRERGASLREFAVFEAIAAAHPRTPWQRWPEMLRRPATALASEFASRHARDARFTMYLQWQADRQLRSSATTARDAGLACGLYRDLAIGAAPDGAEAWANAGSLARGVSIGAPPDAFTPSGQVWDLPPAVPHRLTAAGYAQFRELLAANMRHAGALRIDHVMGLSRLFWVPDGARAADGAYVSYPLDDLLGVLALESVRARCIVIGEDLGTVPEGLRERLAGAGLLSYRVLWFERDAGGFHAPHRYPAQAAACVSTHDLPTIAGWWSGVDIDEKSALGLLAEDDAQREHAARQADKALLAAALERDDPTQATRIDAAAPHDAAITAAVHRHLALSPAALVLVQADDLAGEIHAQNLPGTDRERPNWRRRLGVDAESLWATEAGTLTAAACAPRRAPPSGAGH